MKKFRNLFQRDAVQLTMVRITVLAIIVVILLATFAAVRAQNPTAIKDDVFWRMITDFSEPGGTFRYENLLSNEMSYQKPMASVKLTARGGAYIGVGPEQNFTYIAAIEPKISFIVDIRRQNMLEHLMYKALFEISTDRVEFVSRLFSRQPPPGLSGEPTADELFRAYSSGNCDRQLLDQTFRNVTDRLTVQHGFALTEEDLKVIEHVVQTFCAAGPQIDYGFVNAPSNLTAPSYAELMTATDGRGRNWSYLASAENFDRIRDMESSNLIVPLVGNFAGKKALKSVAQYLKTHDFMVSAFYVSNVEQYLNEAQKIAFRLNVAQLPATNSSRLIRFTPPESTTSSPLSLLLTEPRSLFHLLSKQ
jgi:hypothetical protein